MEQQMIIVAGACGKMGREIVRGVLQNESLKLVGAVDVCHNGSDIGELAVGRPIGVYVGDKLEDVIQNSDPRNTTLIDFTRREAAVENVKTALKHGLTAVVGTTGFSAENLAAFDALARENRTGILVAPNFSLGAVIMMKHAAEISRYFNQAEIIEYHNDRKIDSPSGTALATARGMSANTSAYRNPAPNGSPCRGGDYEGIRIHSVRLNCLVAHQEVLFSGCGELLTIRHDSYSRESFIPGIMLGVSKVRNWQGLVVGLDQILD